MLNILNTTKYVAKNSQNAWINDEAIQNFVEDIRKKDLLVSEIDISGFDWNTKDLIALTFIFNSINFCYWAKKGKDKWTVEINDEELDGAIGLFQVLEKETKRNPSFINAKHLSSLGNSDLSRILKGNTTIPLFNERLKCLNEFGSILAKKFRGNVMEILVDFGRKDAVKITELLVKNFPRFNDYSTYKGKKVAFYKRAQCNVKMVNDILEAKREKGLTNLDKITAFADYKLPQILRKLRILNYSDKLAKGIDNFELIEKDSAIEVEIRANTIWAVEKIKNALKKKYNFITSSHIDSMLWKASQTKNKDDKPYHRTLTIAY
ncbi:hypothetical protein JW766_04380 [Candidatus Dojkabacteria bacterium]|nr:hypothetical protein [Candidatus Dojkabacteria bacterium]